jgi:hypothetical protein
MIVLVMAVKFLEGLYLERNPGDLVRTALAVSVVSAALIAFIYFGNRD